MMLCYFVLLLVAAPTYQRTVFYSHTEQKPQILTIQFAEPSDFQGWGTERIREYEIIRCLDCKLTTIESSTFDLPGNKIKTLNLTSNNIATLKSKAFSGLILLKRLILSNNNIKDIENEAFNGLVSLEDLDLSNNNIDQLAFDNVLPELKSLDLSYNNLKNLDYKLLVDKMPKLTFINIQNNPLPCNLGKEMESYFKEDNLEFILATDPDNPSFKCDDVNIPSEKPNLD